MLVRVNGISGLLCSLEVPDGCVFRDLRSLIKDATGISRRDMHLTVNGVIAVDAETVTVCDVMLVRVTRECRCCDRTDHLKVCKGCLSMYYCSVECQRSDWRRHKADNECNPFRR